MTRKFFVLAFALLALVSFPAVSAASGLYGIEYLTGTGFFKVDQTNGALALIGNTGNTATGDLTSDLATTIWTNDMTNDALLTVDPATGAITSSTKLTDVQGAPVPIVSLAWDKKTGNLYGNTAVGFGGTAADTLYQINPATGLSSLIGAIGFNTVYALGFDNSGTLYGISQTSNALLTISTGTGAGAAVAPVALTAAYDLAFRPEDNVMFVADSGTSSLYNMNPGTGAATLVGPYGSATNNVGLAFLVPEPGTIGLLLGGFGLLALRARKRAQN